MRRSPCVLALAGLILSSLFWTACGSSSKQIPTSVSVSPNPISLDVNTNSGNVVQLTSTVLDQNGAAVSNFTFTYTTSDPTIADVSTGGLVCAGQWDSETSPVNCRATSNDLSLLSQQKPAFANITVTATNGHVTLSTVVPAFVHLHVDKVTVTTLSPSNCVSQSVESHTEPVYQATAYSNGADITSTVGTFSWTITPSAVGTADNTNMPSESQCLKAASGSIVPSSNCVYLVAETPGVATVTASVSNTSGSASAIGTPAQLVTCPVESISLTGPNSATAETLNTGGTAALTATATDSNGYTLTNISFTYYSSSPVNVPASSTITATSPGSSVVIAACSPASCNFGQYPVFSNGIPTTVSGTSAATTVYVTGTPASGSTAVIVPISTSSNSAGTAISLALPAGTGPNSFILNKAGTKGYLGSDNGVITLDTASNTVGSPTLLGVGNKTYVGKVLAISPDGNWLVTAAHAQGLAANNANIIFTNTTTNSSKLFTIANASSADANATSADFSPDSSTALVLAGDGQLYTFNIAAGVALSTVTAPNSLKPSMVSFLTQGSFAITAGNSTTLMPLATCNLGLAVGSQDTSLTPTLLQAVPNPVQVSGGASNNVGAVAVSGPTMSLLKTSTNGATPVQGASGTACASPSLTDSFSNVVYSADPTITPAQLIVTPDGSKVFVTGSTSALYGWNLTNNTQIAIGLANGATSTAGGGVTTDSQTMYVSASDGTVHRILTNGSDAGAITLGVSMTPQFVVVQPK
jgi:hypothetical protein